MHSRSLRTALLFVCATTVVTFGSNPTARAEARNRIFEPDSATPATVRALLSVLADDSMQGRGTATEGGDRAAKFIAAQMKRIGLKPGGDSGYFQRVPLGLRNGRPYGLASFAAFDSLPKDQRRMAVNVIGVIPGYKGILDRVTREDVPAADSVVLIDAHYDHLGIGRPVNGDSIYNGADDDGSGTVAVLEIARTIHLDDPHRRTLVFILTTGEEVGLLGTNWYVAHPYSPLGRMVANLEFEMIGRPDSLAGGPGHAWLTGYNRTTMGQIFHDAGLPIVPDPRPCQHFFTRSDNKAFADAGIPAQTLSTFNLHADYHRPSDEISKIDFVHMAKVIDAGVHAVRDLADGSAPTWLPGGRPGQPDTKPESTCVAGRGRGG